MTHIDKLRRALVRTINDDFDRNEPSRYLHELDIVRVEAVMPDGTERSKSVAIRVWARGNPLPAVFEVIVRAKKR